MRTIDSGPCAMPVASDLVEAIGLPGAQILPRLQWPFISGASMPNSRMRSEPQRIVSPSVTRHGVVMIEGVAEASMSESSSIQRVYWRDRVSRNLRQGMVLHGVLPSGGLP